MTIDEAKNNATSDNKDKIIIPQNDVDTSYFVYAHAEAVCSSLPIRVLHLGDERIIGCREQPFGAEGAAMIHQVVYQMLRVLYSYAERKTFRFEPYTR